MPTTPNGLRYPGNPDSEPPNGPLQIGNLAADVDAHLTSIYASLARYYKAGTATLTGLTTSPTAPPGGASLSLPAGTYDVDISARFALDVSTIGRAITLHLYVGGTSVFNTGFTVDTTDLASRNHSDFTRITLSATSTVSLRAAASATGGTQGITTNVIRAVRVL